MRSRTPRRILRRMYARATGPSCRQRHGAFGGSFPSRGRLVNTAKPRSEDPPNTAGCATASKVTALVLSPKAPNARRSAVRLSRATVPVAERPHEGSVR